MASVYNFRTPNYKVAPTFAPLVAPKQELVNAGLGGSSKQGSRSEFTVNYGMKDQIQREIQAHRVKVRSHMKEYDSVEDYKKSDDFNDDAKGFHRLNAMAGEMQARTNSREEYSSKLSGEQLSAIATSEGWAQDEFGRTISDEDLNKGRTMTVAEVFNAQKGQPLIDGNGDLIPFSVPDAAQIDKELSDLIKAATTNLGSDKFENSRWSQDGKSFTLSEILAREQNFKLGNGDLVSILSTYSSETEDNTAQLRNALNSAMGDLSREDYAQLFYDQKRQGLMYELPKIKKQDGSIDYDKNGNVQYVKKDNGELEFEERAIKSNNDFNYWAGSILKSGVSSKRVNEKSYIPNSTTVNRNGEEEPGELNKYDLIQLNGNGVFETGIETDGITEVVDKVISISGETRRKRVKNRVELFEELGNGLEETLKGEIKEGYKIDDVLLYYDTPSKIKDMVTDEGYKRMKEVLNKTLMKQVDQYVKNGTITKRKARDMFALMLEGEGSNFDPSEWRRLKLGEETISEEESENSVKRMYDVEFYQFNRYTNGEKIISEEEYEKKVLLNKIQNPLSQVSYEVLKENEMKIVKYNQSYYHDTEFNFTNLQTIGSPIRYLGNSFNSDNFTSPAYAVSSTKAYKGLRPKGKISLGVNMLVHKHDLKNFNGSIDGANGKINFDLSDKKDRERLEVHSMQSTEGRANVAAAKVWDNSDIKKENRVNYFIIPGAIMDHDPYRLASVAKDGFIASEDSNKNAHKLLK